MSYLDTYLPRISFVMATCNGEAYVVEQLLSILTAIGPFDEVIISDDFSNDRTVQLIETISDKRIVLLKNTERVGYQRNFWRAIRRSKGEYIFFSDQDDICLPERISISIYALASFDCVCGDAIMVSDNLELLQPSFFSWRKAKFDIWSLFCKPAVIGATMACRRNFLLSKGPFPKGVPHDFWLSFEASRTKSLFVSRRPFIQYRRHGGVASLSGSSLRRSLMDVVRERWCLICAVLLGPRSYDQDAL